MGGFLEDALDLEQAIKALSPEAKVERRREQWRAYNYSNKSRARARDYDESPKGIARKLIDEKTIRAARRAPGPCMDDVPLGPNPFGNAFGSENGRIRNPVVFSGEPMYSGPFGRFVPARFPSHPFDIRTTYAMQIREQRRKGVLMPMTFMQLMEMRS